MIARTLNLKPGSVIAWKEYPWYKRVWNTVLGRELPLNKFKPVTDRIELLVTKWYDSSIKIYAPTKAYNNAETAKLRTIVYGNKVLSLEDLNASVNCVRPNTLDENTKRIENVKYYFEITKK